MPTNLTIDQPIQAARAKAIGRSNKCSPRTKMVIWSRAAGRCQFRGCNKHMIGDLLSGNEDAIFGFVAHIVADAPGGPRGDPARSHLLADDLSNVMLLCYEHHKLVDSDDVAGYPEARLVEMKLEHERRVEIVTDMLEDRASHVLCYAANVGAHESLIGFDRVRSAMLPARYPADGRATRIEMLGSSIQDSEPEFWNYERTNLQRKFSLLIQQRLTARDIGHLSVFALAPQPLLIELGRLLGDIAPADIHQLHREPKGWTWAEQHRSITFEVAPAAHVRGPPALVLALSADIEPARVTAVLGPNAAIWSIRATQPGNDIMRSKADLVEFGRLIRRILNDIKKCHGENHVLSIFPALPVSAAVEVGRAWMPKADLPLRIFDQCTKLGGFVPTLQIETR
jgi:SMODS-associated and fused to various effectors sensor domain